MRYRQAGHWVALLLALAAGASCEPVRRAEQCNEVSAMVNDALETIGQLHEAPAAAAQKYSDIASRYSNLAAALRGMRPSNDRLASSLRDYAGIFERAASTCRTLAKVAPRPANKPVAAAKKPSAKKPSAKKPSAKKPSAKKPSAKKPSAKKPATKKGKPRQKRRMRPGKAKPAVTLESAQADLARILADEKRLVGSIHRACSGGR